MAKRKLLKKERRGKQKQRSSRQRIQRSKNHVLGRQKLQIKQRPSPFFENVHRAKIKVIGIGGGGGNIVSEISSHVQRFEFVGANTDKQILRQLPKKVKVFSFGQDLTGGLGCGMDANLGERAARAEKDRIKRLLEGSDLVMFVATLGGGTGSGASVVFAEIAQELHILTIGIFTLPFTFEGEKRRQIAQGALEKMKPFVNAYGVIPNDHIFQLIDQKTPLRDALSSLNKKLASALRGFMETLVFPGLINIDFADVRSILEGRGRLAFINSAEALGPMRASQASQAVLTNPLYSYTKKGADRILFNIVGDRNMKMQEVASISGAISQDNPKARIIFGMACNSRVKEHLKVTLFAVGCEEELEQKEGKKEQQIKSRGKQKHRRLPSPPKQKEEAKKQVVQEKPMENKQNKEQESVPSPQARVRRNGLEVRKAIDEELKKLEQQEKQWETPAFLRSKS